MRKKLIIAVLILVLSAIPVIWAFAAPDDDAGAAPSTTAAVPGNAGDFKVEPAPTGPSKLSATANAPDTEPTHIFGKPEDQAALPFGESPAWLAPGLAKGDNGAETVDGAVRGRSMVLYDLGSDKRRIVWLRVQQPNSDLKPIWQGRAWWLTAWETKTVEISGVSATLASNADTNTSDGIPEVWLEASWIKDGKEYQMMSVNVTLDDFVKMANSVK